MKENLTKVRRKPNRSRGIRRRCRGGKKER